MAGAGSRFGQGRQQRVTGPAGRGTAEVEAEPEEEDGRPHEPVAEHVQRGEGHVIGPDHQRDQEVAEGPGQDRDDHQEDHHRGVHREQHRVELGRNLAALATEQLPEAGHVLPGPGQLPADAQGQCPANQQHEQGGDQELDPDHLVIGREDVLADERRFVVPVMIVVGVVGGRCGVERAHGVASSAAPAGAVPGGVTPSKSCRALSSLNRASRSSTASTSPRIL